MTHEELAFVNSLIGLPYKKGAQGQEEYDCWGVAAVIEQRLFGRTMPPISDPPENIRELMEFVVEHPVRKLWKMIDGPVHGSLVEMSRNRDPFHIGVYLDVDDGGIIHSSNSGGVCWDRQVTLAASGWRRFTYHDWIG